MTSRVRMAEYSDADIETYVATGEPLDKAGGYAVQGLGGRLVAAVDGCLTNVIGLPLTTTRALLERAGVPSSRPSRSGGARASGGASPSRAAARGAGAARGCARASPR